jgi:hypothetical protein
MVSLVLLAEISGFRELDRVPLGLDEDRRRHRKSV